MISWYSQRVGGACDHPRDLRNLTKTDKINNYLYIQRIWFVVSLKLVCVLEKLKSVRNSDKMKVRWEVMTQTDQNSREL